MYLTGDAVRILYNLGIGYKMEDIAHGKLSSGAAVISTKVAEQDVLTIGIQ